MNFTAAKGVKQSNTTNKQGDFNQNKHQGNPSKSAYQGNEKLRDQQVVQPNILERWLSTSNILSRAPQSKWRGESPMDNRYEGREIYGKMGKQIPNIQPRYPIYEKCNDVVVCQGEAEENEVEDYQSDPPLHPVEEIV